MSLITENGEIVHIPKRRDLFQFDAEVAAVFDSMAPRSIPLYNEVHRLHVSLLRGHMHPGSVVSDIGSSTGHLFRNIAREFGVPFAETGVHGMAVDSSGDMMDLLRAEFPGVETFVADITTARNLPAPSDVMFCLYVLQFIQPDRRHLAYDWLVRNVKMGGCLVLGQKEDVGRDWMAAQFSEEYYKFRRDNGYSQAEIDAKTAALRGSMWPVEWEELEAELNERGVIVYETTRWLQFSTVLGIRRG